MILKFPKSPHIPLSVLRDHLFCCEDNQFHPNVKTSYHQGRGCATCVSIWDRGKMVEKSYMIDRQKQKCAQIYLAPNILRRLVRDQGWSLDKHREGCYCQAEPPLLFFFSKTINSQHGKCWHCYPGLSQRTSPGRYCLQETLRPRHVWSSKPPATDVRIHWRTKPVSRLLEIRE